MGRPRKYHTEAERRAAKAAYQAVYHKEYRAKNKQRLEEAGRQWRIANKEKIAAKRIIYKATRRAEISAKQREYYYTTYKGTAGYRAQYTKQNRKRPIKVLERNEIALGRKKPDICEACGGTDGGIVFDHCHERGHPRGWLCDRCNVALGCLRDDIDRLRKLIAYLERNLENTAPQLVLSGI